MFWLCIGMILVAGLFLWAASRPDTWPNSRTRLRGGACVLLTLAAFSAYALYQEVTSRDRLAQILPVYPDAKTTSWTPQVSEARYWMLETNDGFDKIIDFYTDVASESGWGFSANQNDRVLHLKLETSDTLVSIMALRQKNRTQLTYQVTGRPSS